MSLSAHETLESELAALPCQALSSVKRNGVTAFLHLSSGYCMI